MEEKNKFESGMWNANAVMMGGLGKEPELEEESVGGSGLITPVRSVLVGCLNVLIRKVIITCLN